MLYPYNNCTSTKVNVYWNQDLVVNERVRMDEYIDYIRPTSMLVDTH